MLVTGGGAADVLSEDTAQKLMNVDGQDIGDGVVILETGDIGQVPE